MKKILSLFILSGLIVFSACDPMEDIYNEIDADREPVNAEVSYTFTADDYAAASEYAIKDAVTVEDTANAEDIEDMEAFNMYYTAETYVPYVLTDMYDVLNDGSVATVTYDNYIGGLDYLDNFGSADAYELVTADYDAMGEGEDEPGEWDNFSSSCSPEDYLPDWLLTKYPSAVADDMVAITYAYYSGGVVDLTDYYSFDGTEWAPVSGVYVLTDDDYDEMGAPGAYSNFAYYEGDGPEYYLPAFLEDTYTYAQAGDIKVIVYNFYEGGGVTSICAKEYHFDGSEWTEYDAIIETTNQFIHNGTGWVFDPTETITMSNSDFQIVVDYVGANISVDYVDSYGTAESYYGAGAYYGNFDLRAGKWDAEVFNSWEEAIEDALGTALLPILYPSATLQVNGVDMYYRVIFATYSGAAADYAMKFQVTKAGPDPEFTLDEGPILQ
ncbi:MAG: hypothetical protein K8R31_02200 [Bacteroidales bacterium]|nr:hypothetical protein [Bacteroidales bacterium]